MQQTVRRIDIEGKTYFHPADYSKMICGDIYSQLKIESDKAYEKVFSKKKAKDAWSATYMFGYLSGVHSLATVEPPSNYKIELLSYVFTNIFGDDGREVFKTVDENGHKEAYQRGYDDAVQSENGKVTGWYDYLNKKLFGLF